MSDLQVFWFLASLGSVFLHLGTKEHPMHKNTNSVQSLMQLFLSCVMFTVSVETEIDQT